MVPLAQTDDALFDRIVSTNIKGVFNMLRLAAARMHEGGRIINLSTSVNRLALPGYAVYAATKSAVETMLPLAREQGKKMDILTCVRPENVEGSHPGGLGPINFSPTGSFSIPEYPELTLHYPPALKIVQHCYESGYTLLHSATPGPMGLAALLTAKMLKLPIHVVLIAWI